MSLHIDINSVPSDQQRYETAGDWYYEDTDTNHLSIVVTQQKDWRYEALVAVHELVEALLCRHDGVSQAMVDEFDMHFKGDGDPGDSPEAPYHHQHACATVVEVYLANNLGVNIEDYEKALEGTK